MYCFLFSRMTPPDKFFSNILQGLQVLENHLAPGTGECFNSSVLGTVKGIQMYSDRPRPELTINGGCSLYVLVRSKFEAAVSITRRFEGGIAGA